MNSMSALASTSLTRGESVTSATLGAASSRGLRCGREGGPYVPTCAMIGPRPRGRTMHSFEHDTDASRTVFGTGTVSRVADELRRMGGRRALVLSTPGQRGLATLVAGVLGEATAGVFDGAAAHTPVEVTEVALARAKEVGADSVVSVGGGSTTGLGK